MAIHVGHILGGIFDCFQPASDDDLGGLEEMFNDDPAVWGREAPVASHVQSMWREKPRLLVMFRACKREKPRLLFMFRACGEWSPGCYSRSERVEREASVSSHVQSMGRREDPGSSHVRSVLREASVSSHVHVCGEPPLCHVSERAERSRSF